MLRHWELTSLQHHIMPSTFNMADISVLECDSLLATPTLKSNAEQKVCKKRIYHSCLVRVEKSVPRDHCLTSLCKVSWCQTVILGWIFLFAPILIIFNKKRAVQDVFYQLCFTGLKSQTLCMLGITGACSVILSASYFRYIKTRW